MFRHRVRPPLPPLDEVTAERLLGGAPIDDLPEAYRPLGALLADARRPGTERELAGSAAAAAMFVTAHDASASRRRVFSLGAAALCAVMLAATTGTAVAATQGALPQPIQAVAHEALGAVGISVPDITDDRKDDGGSGTPGATTADPGAGSSVPSTTIAPTKGAPAGASGTTGTTGESTGAVEAPQGVVGENPTPGNGNPTPGAGNQGNGNPTPGAGNQGNGGSGNGGGGTAVETPQTPGANLPPQSNGKGNGPPQVPPGQAK